MPQIRVMINGKLDEWVSTQEKEIMGRVVQQAMKTDVTRYFTEDETKSAPKFGHDILADYIKELHKGYEEACKGSGNSCHLDTTKVVDLEAAAGERALTSKEDKASEAMLTFGATVITMFQTESHMKNVERERQLRRGEEPYQGMYG